MNEAADKLLDDAINLVIRLQDDPGNPLVAKMVADFRARGRAQDAAWRRVCEIHGMSGRLLSDRPAHRRVSRRKMLAGVFGGLGLASLGYAVVPGMILRAQADHLTGKGEMVQVTLPDGSRALLGPDSALALAFGPGQRGVRLLQGLCYFEIQHFGERPFQALAGDVVAVSEGGSFDLTRDAGFIGLSVAEGGVLAQIEDASAAEGLVLPAGSWLTYDSASGRIERGKRPLDQIAAWRERVVIADQEPVSALVARIGRWLPGEVVMADPFIGDRLVSGLFDLSDPLRALEAVVHPAGGKVHQVGDFLTLVSPL